MPKTLPVALTLITATLLLGACSDKVKDTHPQQLVTQRQAVFKKMTKTLEPMGLVARGHKDYVKVEFMESAQALKDLSSQPWVFFSADGNYPPTKATPEVWSKPAEFEQEKQAFIAATDKLQAAVQSKDKAQVGTAYEAVHDSCKSCHKQFKAR